MATSSTRARNHYKRQRQIAGAAVIAVRNLFKRRAPIAQVVATVAAYQYASATAGSSAVASAGGTQALVNAAAFAGVSSAGFPISEPIVSTIDRFVEAPPMALPDNWWGDALDFMASIEQLIESEVQDAGRSASQVEMAAGPMWTNYVRLLVPPSCKRCTVLAGRIYRDLDGFKRHPQCDCQMWPVESWEEAHDAGLVSSPQEAFEKGHIRDLTVAETQAINDGADINAIINSAAGVETADLFGRRVKHTTRGTTKRSAWRRANPTLLVRLRPESIYEIADGDRAEALRLLRLYGYLTS